MVKFPVQVRGLNVVFVVFSLLVMGGAAYVMSTGSAVNYKTGASNVVENATGTLVKKGTAAFSPCKNVTTDYALIGSQPETPINAQMTPKPTGATPACTPLTIQSSVADPLVGKRVAVTGTLQGGIFYANTVKVVEKSPTPQPKKP